MNLCRLLQCPEFYERAPLALHRLIEAIENHLDNACGDDLFTRNRRLWLSQVQRMIVMYKIDNVAIKDSWSDGQIIIDEIYITILGPRYP